MNFDLGNYEIEFKVTIDIRYKMSISLVDICLRKIVNNDININHDVFKKMSHKYPKIIFTDEEKYRYHREKELFISEYMINCDIGEEDDPILDKYIASYMICKKCNKRTSYGFEESTCYYGEDGTGVIMYECVNCHIHYVVCLKCSILMKICKKQIYEDYDENYYNFRNENLFKFIDDDFVLFLYDMYWYNNLIFGPITGDDGGYTVTFKCVKCNCEYYFCDK